MKQFLPFLTDDIGRSLSVENEVVVTNSLPNALENSPDGWENNTLQWARNNEFRGIIKSYTTSLKFYLQGAKILRNAFYRTGMEIVLYFIWLKLDQSFGGDYKYRGWYKGEPDFGTFKDEYDGVEISLSEGGFFKDLQANKTVVQEVPFDKDAVLIYMDGLFLYQKLNYEDSGFDISFNTYSTLFLGPYILTSQDGSSVGFQIESEFLEEAPNTFPAIQLSDNIIIKNLLAVPVDITISGKISFTCTSMTSLPAWGIKFRYLTSFQSVIGPAVNTYEIIETPAMVVGEVYSTDFSIDITLQPNESLFRNGEWVGGVGVDAVIHFNDDSKSSISFKTRSPNNIIQAYRVYDYGNKLVGRLSAGATLSSPLFEPDYNLMFTCGDAIRNIPNAVMKWNFSDYYKSVDAIKCTALDIINNQPVLTSRYDKFLKDSSIASLGECSHWSLEPADEYIYDTVQSGYPTKSSQSNEDVNGKYSFNNTYLWAIDITRRKKNQYECKAACYADPYDIELIRVNFNNKDTTTANTDNSIFALDCEKKDDIVYTGPASVDAVTNTFTLTGDISAIKQYLLPNLKFVITSLSTNVYTITQVISITGTTAATFKVAELLVDSGTLGTITLTISNLYQLRRKTYTSITGIPDDGTMFNLEITARRNLENHLRWLRSSFDHLDMHKLLFKSTDKNRDLVTVDSLGNTVAESADIPVASMGQKVYLPYYTKFNIKSPDNLKDLLDNNDDGKFDYKMNGIALDGFPIDVRTEDSHLETQEYTLLLTANNDLTLLINNR